MIAQPAAGSALWAVGAAVRTCLEDVGSDDLVLVACSGGPDSTALLLGALDASTRGGPRVGAVTVDHQLQPGSADVAAGVASLATHLGAKPVHVVSVQVDLHQGTGLESAARSVRRTALVETVLATDAACVLLGHTLQDQAETVLLGLARGSGARSLAGMPSATGAVRRPLLHLPREVTVAACAEAAVSTWCDPHNTDLRFRRSRVRSDVLPALEAALGPGVVPALARTAALLRDDDDALEQWAQSVYRDAGDGTGLRVAPLLVAPPAVRRRVLRRLLLEHGVRPGALTARHLAIVDAFVSDWHGQGPAALPGPRWASRRCGSLYVTASDPASSAASDDAGDA